MKLLPPCLLVLVVALAMAGLAHGQAFVIETQGLRVELTGVGKGAADDVKAVVQEQIQLTEDKEMSAPLADDLAFFVRQRYLDLGYPDAVVNWEIQGGAALLAVTEGDVFKVGAIRYEGNTSQEEVQLTRYLLRPTHDKLGGSSASPVFVEADIKAGAQLVQRYFQAQGYLEAAVAEPVFDYNKATMQVGVLVKITEGRKYLFGSVQFTGDLLGRDKDVQEAVSEFSGQPFSEVKVETARAKIASVYQMRGHFAAVVNAVANPAANASGTVPVLYQIQAGPVYEISAVEIDPKFSAGAQRLIKASFKPAVGTTYSPSELEIMNRRLLDTGVFARMELEPVAQPGGTLVLQVKGEEGMRTTVGFYGGYETFQGPIIGAEVRQVNFMDSGNTASAKAEYTGRGINGSLKLLDPALFGSRYSLAAEVGAETFSIFDYDRQSYFGKLALERRWNKHITASLFGQVSANSTESTELTPEELGPDEYNLGSVGMALVFDYRNSPVVPTDGWMASAGVTTSGGDVQFLKSEISLAVYQPLTKKLRIAAAARARAVQISGGVDELPIDLRLFNGGATSVRSFAEREMGPKSKSGTPLGGTATHVFSVELSYEIRPNLELALFGDAGTVSREEDNVFASPSDLRYAIGLGIRYKLPIGPLRVDYGFNPDRREGEDMGTLHITFGFAF